MRVKAAPQEASSLRIRGRAALATLCNSIFIPFET
jgi:hypothetical protein